MTSRPRSGPKSWRPVRAGSGQPNRARPPTGRRTGGRMARRTISRGMWAGLLAGMFAAGFICGTVTERRADAQIKELGGSLLKDAAGSGGILGQAAQLGTSIVEMQDHVNGLQKNLETLRKVQSALTAK